jgi:puromycin-sensitive aminopeptidase
MEMLATDAFRPEWERWVSFGLSRSAAFDVDALKSTRPIEYQVESPEDAEGMFDILTYEKGAAVVRMLEQYLGEDRFRDGIRRYLAAHAHANTETHDLWDALEEATGEPVRRMMDSWIFQGGHPAVTVRGGERPSVSQRRFRYLPDPDAGAEWIVPLRLRTTDGDVRVLLEKPSQPLDVPVSSILTVNLDGTGVYRVRLDDEQLAHLAANGPQGLSPIERYGLVDDTWAMTLAGDVRAAQFAAVAWAFRDEDDLSVWQRIIASCDSLRRATDPSSLDGFRRWLVDLVTPACARLGDEPRPDEGERARQLRGALFAAVGLLGDDPLAIERARGIVEAPAGDPALVAAAIDIVAAHGDATTHARYVERMKQAASPQEAERYRGALAEFPGEDELRRTLDLTLDGTIRTQDVPFVIRRALRNSRQGPSAWRFVSQRWDDITAAIPSNLVARLLEGISALAEPELAADVESFLDAHPVPQGRVVIEQHRERLRVHLAFRERERPRLAEVFGTA